MKVLLINPPRANEIFGNNPKIIEKQRGFNPPLGLLSVATYLLANSDHTVEVIDAQVEELSYPELADRIGQVRPDVVGMTAMTMTIIDVIKTAALIKELDARTTVVLGGPHGHLFPEETVALPDVDVVVMGEGEEAFTELLESLGDREAMARIQGLAFQANGRFVNTGVREPITDLDALPFPDRSLAPYEKYGSLLAVSDMATTIFTSRGCPYKCAFCDRPHLGKKFRARSADSVIAEIEACVALGIREFLVYDDTFTVDKNRVMAICEQIISRKLDIGFDIRARVDTVNEEMIAALKKAGCQGIHYGVEAGTPHILKNLNKGITLERVAEVFKFTRKAGIPVLAYFMIGNPGETEADIRTTFKVIRELNPDYVHVTVLTPFPGTKIYFDALERGLIESDVWRKFAQNPTSGFQPPHWGEFFSREELNGLLVECYKRFYIRPGYILRRLAALKSWPEFKKKARAGLRVLGMKA